MTDLGEPKERTPEELAAEVDDLLFRYCEAVALLKRLGAHLPGECWCGRIHSESGEPWRAT